MDRTILPSPPSHEQEGFQLRQLLERHPRQSSSYGQLHTPTTINDGLSEATPSIGRDSDEYFGQKDSTPESFKWPLRFRLASWRFTIITGLSTTVFVFICNVALIIWAYATLGRDNTVIFKGSCDRMKTIDTWSHLGINVLSTLVLGASNAAMQLIVAPSRDDIRKAHAQSRTVDIGIHGLRNWRFMSRRRRSIWILLLVTTIPLHLLYNSVIYASTSTTDYRVLLASESFVQGAAYDFSWQLDYGRNISSNDTLKYEDSIDLRVKLNDSITVLQDAARSKKLKKLDNTQCLQAYNTPFISGYRSAILVTNSTATNNTLLNYFSYAASDGEPTTPTWICGNTVGAQACDTTAVMANPATWTIPFNSTIGAQDQMAQYSKTPLAVVEYCLAEEIPPTCTVEILPALLWTVIVCNAVKVLCFLLLLSTHFVPLVTIGDAISAFLSEPDETTRNLGPLSAQDVRKAMDRTCRSCIGFESQTKSQTRAPHWTEKRHRWFLGASKSRWFLTYFICLLYWIVGLSLWGGAMESTRDPSFANQWKSGFGSVFLDTVVKGVNWNVGASVLIANSPQLALSFVYISYNSLFTSLAISREWTSMSHQKRGLRTSIPEGKQRTTYYLSLPYRFGVPLLIASGLLHWLLSQSIYIVLVSITTADGNPSPDSISTVGWSSLALMLILLLGFMLMAVLFGFGFRKYPSGMPLVRCNSRAISAACHPLNGREDEAFKEIQYGVIERLDNGKELVGFSSTEVKPLATGRAYY